MVEVVLSTLDSFLLFYFVDRFYEKEVYSKFKITFGVALQALIISIFSLYTPLNNFIGKLVLITLICLILKYFFDISVPKIVLLVFTEGLIIGIVELLTFWVMVVVFKAPYNFIDQNGMYYLYFGLFSKSIVLVLIKYTSENIKRLKLLNKSSTYQVILIITVNLVLIFAGGWFHRYIDMSKINSYVFITVIIISIFIFNFMTINITKKIVEYTEKEIQWDLKESGYKNQIHYVKTMDELFNNLRSQHHEFNNHLNCLYGLLNNSNYEDANAYISNLLMNLHGYKEIIKTSNPVLSSLLSVKYHAAKKIGVGIKFNTLSIDDINIEFIDLTIVLGNILDNAITACERVLEEEKKLNLACTIEIETFVFI